MNKITAEVICRALLAIVAAIRKEHGLPEYHNITISMGDSIAGITERDVIIKEPRNL